MHRLFLLCRHLPCRSHYHDIVTPGGRKSPIAEAIDDRFLPLGWVEKSFETKIIVDANEYDSPTHKVDYYKNHEVLKEDFTGMNWGECVIHNFACFYEG